VRRPTPWSIPRRWRGGAAVHAVGAFALLVAGTVAVVVLHVLSPEVSPANHYISEYGNRTWGWLLSAALILIAAGLLALGAQLRTDARARTRRARVGPTLLQASGGMLIVAALFSTDRLGGEVEVATLAGKVHGVMAIGAFSLVVLAMILLSPRVSDEREPLGRSSALALPLALIAPAVAAVAYAVMPDADGLRQRAFLAIVFGWLLATAFQVYSLRWAGSRGRRDGPG
jgi:hypothetical protein